MQESKNKEFINSLKKQRTYLGKFHPSIVTIEIIYDAISLIKLILVQKIQRMIAEFDDKISLVASECNVKTQEIDSLRLKLNQYAKKLKIQKRKNQNYEQIAQKRNNDASYWNRIRWGGFLAAEAAILYCAAPAFVAVNVVGAVGCLGGWCYNYFFADVKPGVTKVNVVTRNGRRIKTD